MRESSMFSAAFGFDKNGIASAVIFFKKSSASASVRLEEEIEM